MATERPSQTLSLSAGHLRKLAELVEEHDLKEVQVEFRFGVISHHSSVLMASAHRPGVYSGVLNTAAEWLIQEDGTVISEHVPEQVPSTPEKAQDLPNDHGFNF